MKKITLLLIMFILIGCAAIQSIQPNNEARAGIGDIFFSHEVPYNFKFDLTVGAASNDRLSLFYNEYFFGPPNYVWMVKAGFNKSFDYKLSESKIVNFKDYSFEIIEVQDSTVKYRRIK